MVVEIPCSVFLLQKWFSLQPEAKRAGGKKCRNKKATIAYMIGNRVLGSSGFAMLPKLVQWAIFFAGKGDVFRNWIKWWQVWTSASLQPPLRPDISPPNERRTETAAYFSGHLFQEHHSQGSRSGLQGNVLQISRNGCLSFNPFESTFFDSECWLVMGCIWVWRLSIQIGCGSACGSFVHSLCSFSSRMHKVCNETKSPDLPRSTLRPIKVLYLRKSGTDFDSVSCQSQYSMSKYFTLPYPRRPGS